MKKKCSTCQGFEPIDNHYNGRRSSTHYCGIKDIKLDANEVEENSDCEKWVEK